MCELSTWTAHALCSSILHKLQAEIIYLTCVIADVTIVCRLNASFVDENIYVSFYNNVTLC